MEENNVKYKPILSVNDIKEIINDVLKDKDFLPAKDAKFIFNDIIVAYIDRLEAKVYMDTDKKVSQAIQLHTLISKDFSDKAMEIKQNKVIPIVSIAGVIGLIAERVIAHLLK